MRSIFKITLAVLAIATLTSCPGSKDDVPSGGVVPGSVSLVFPENNSECTEGQSLNTEESGITFRWQAGTNADSYEVNVRNLEANDAGVFNATTNEASISLLKNTPYEWFVVSKNSGSDQTATSAKWRFYNAGEGVLNYAPFPAEVVSPTRGQSVNSTGSITLQWEGNDVDNDITEYEVFFGTDANPTAILGTTAQSSLEATISSGQTYYWRVTTKDGSGNTSQSAIFDFKTL